MQTNGRPGCAESNKTTAPLKLKVCAKAQRQQGNFSKRVCLYAVVVCWMTGRWQRSFEELFGQGSLPAGFEEVSLRQLLDAPNTQLTPELQAFVEGGVFISNWTGLPVLCATAADLASAVAEEVQAVLGPAGEASVRPEVQAAVAGAIVPAMQAAMEQEVYGVVRAAVEAEVGPAVQVAVEEAVQAVIARLDNGRIMRRNAAAMATMDVSAALKPLLKERAGAGPPLPGAAAAEADDEPPLPGACEPYAVGVAIPSPPFPATVGELRGLTPARLSALSVLYNDSFDIEAGDGATERAFKFGLWLQGM